MQTTVDYLAGFLDADGCFTASAIRGGRAWSPRLTASGVHPAPMEEAKDRWGGSLNRYDSCKARGRPVWLWAAGGSSLDAALADLDGHLMMRAESASIITEWRQYGGKFRDERGRWRNAGGHAEQTRMHARLKELNRRGHGAAIDEDVPAVVPDLSPEYLAGMIDGDGAITAASNGKVSVAICTVPALIPAAAQRRWGGTLGRYEHHDGNSRPAWVWRISGRSAVPALEELRPHLLVKRAQASLALGLCDLVDADRSRILTLAQKEQRAVLTASLRRLNRRGRPLADGGS